MAKTKIPGIAFIITGMIISGTSYYLNKIRDSNSLRIFVIIGFLFIIYGLFKIILKKAIDLGKPKKHYKHTPEYYQKHHTYKFCPKCGSKLRETFNFCYNCGERVM